MDHDIEVNGYAFGLRPLSMEDAPFVHSLRSDPTLGRYLDGAKTLDEQRRWQEAYLQRANDYYFVIERIDSRRREGAVAIYDITGDHCRAEWGRWIVRHGSLGAAESAHLIHKVAFERLGIGTLYSRTNIENVKVASFHERSGIACRGLVENCDMLHGRSITAVEHAAQRSDWPENGKVLHAMSLRVAQILIRSATR